MIRHFTHYCFCFLGVFFLVQCSKAPEAMDGSQVISAQDIARHIEILATDEFQGRRPFTIGEEKTLDYLEKSFRDMGIDPGNNGSYLQEVPLVEITSIPQSAMVFKGPSGKIQLTYLDEFVALTRRVVPEVSITDSPMIFAGYGIVAPEYQWNDYEGLDVKGKTVVVMVNDPGYGTADQSFFKGNTMTYYGRWTYKYEEAARQGAAGIIIVHDDGPAGYPWQVVRGGWSGPKQYLLAKDNNESRCAVEGWITLSGARKLLSLAGVDSTAFDDARKPGFKAIPLNTSLSVSLENTLKEDRSNNVVGMIPGSVRGDEYIIYTAHWDHLGIGEAVNGDSIYNGAEDNASGVACLLEIAQAFKASRPGPQRSIVFLMVTAEEQGLLGSAYYAANPIFPPAKTVANLNMDALGSYGPTKDLIVIGFGQSQLDDYLTEAAEAQGRYIVPDQEPEKGYFFRSDHFNFAKIGIPALYAEGGLDSSEKGKEWGTVQKNTYTSQRYHKPSDEYRPQDWDLRGMEEDAKLFYEVGYKISGESSFPQWKPGSEFKSIREAYMKP